MKLRRLRCTGLLAALLATLPIAPLCAADPQKTAAADADAPLAEADADTFFRIGETYKLSLLWLYWKTYASQIPKRFDDFDALIKKAGAPAPVVADLEQYRKQISALPWTKTWDQWSEAEKKDWSSANLAWTPWNNWFNVKPYDKLFFFYLGRESMNSAYNIEKNIADKDVTLADRTQEIRDCLSSYATLTTDPGYVHLHPTLNPDILAALKEIQEIRTALEDPLNGTAITQETVTKLGAAGRKIRDLARAGKLLAK